MGKNRLSYFFYLFGLFFVIGLKVVHWNETKGKALHG